MRQNKHIPVILFVTMLTVTSFTIPIVRAQSTSITHLDAPSTAVLGDSVTVRVGATYYLGSDGYAVSIGIFDLDAWWAYGNTVSEMNTCHVNTGQLAQQAFCSYIPSTPSGSDVVVFQLTFSTVKTYRLRASVELYYSNAQLISSASTFQDFTISVTEPQQSQPSTTVQPPAQTYQPTTSAFEQPQQTGETDYGVLLLWCFAIAAVIIFVIWFGAFRKKTKSVNQQLQQPETKPTTANSKVSGKQFCLECGNQLTLGSKFCNKCGAKQG